MASGRRKLKVMTPDEREFRGMNLSNMNFTEMTMDHKDTLRIEEEKGQVGVGLSRQNSKISLLTRGNEEKKPLPDVAETPLMMEEEQASKEQENFSVQEHESAPLEVSERISAELKKAARASKVLEPEIVGETGCIQMEEASSADVKQSSDKWPIKPSTHLADLDEPQHPDLQVTPLIIQEDSKSIKEDQPAENPELESPAIAIDEVAIKNNLFGDQDEEESK